MNAPLSLWSGYYNTKEPEDAVKELLKDGIHTAELSAEHANALLARSENHIETGRRFAEFLKSHKFTMPQGHISPPFDFVSNEYALDRYVRNFELFEAVGVKCAVFHCDYMRDSDIPYEEKIKANIAQLRKLADLIDHVDITVCIENCCGMSKSIDDILFMLDCLRNPKFGICLDTGHLNVSRAESHREFILKAGDKLRALHIADNDGTDDQHVMPFCSGSVDFVEVVKALSEIGYDGLFNYEIPGECNMNPVPFELLHEKVKYIKSGYKYLMKFI